MIILDKINPPKNEDGLSPIELTDETIKKRKEAVLRKMSQDGFDSIIIYADLEHGSNFEYLVGFLPRFEEALLVLHSNGKAFLALGNENLNKAEKARIKAEVIHIPHFSLPNQPMDTDKNIAELLKMTRVDKAKKIGLVGWKLFTSKIENNQFMYDIPHYIVSALQGIVSAKFTNATYMFIGENGVRTVNNANEFAHYEFGAALAGNCILNAIREIKEGVSEMEVASKLEMYGQRNSVVTIMSSGPRFVNANMYPGSNKIEKGDPISLTVGYKGGLQSRCGFAINDERELPKGQEDYLEAVVKPYFNAVKTWLENIHVGMKGGELYDLIEKVLPKEKYGWSLCPGHLCADEEWLSSPIYANSNEVIRSGMLFQIDIIPSVKGYNGISCESGIFIANEQLRRDIQRDYPEIWKRILKRRSYMIEELGIQISEEILPTSVAIAYCQPFLLDKNRALKNV
ncbi:M24 family metallopeptidase [Dorea ammoniilytica]